MLFSVDLSFPVSLQCHCCVFIFPATLQPHLCCCGLPCTSSASFGLCCNQSDLQWNVISSLACLRLANGFLLQVLMRNHLLNVVYKASHSMGPACSLQNRLSLRHDLPRVPNTLQLLALKTLCCLSLSHCRLPSVTRSHHVPQAGICNVDQG